MTPSGRAAPARQAPIGRCKTAGCMCEASYTAGFAAAACWGRGGGRQEATGGSIWEGYGA